MTNEQIDQLLAKATPEPWTIEVVYIGRARDHFGEYRFPFSSHNGLSRTYPKEEAEANAQLMAGAHELAEEVKRLRAAMEKIEDAILTNSVEWRATSEALKIAREALDRPPKKEPAPLVTHHTDDGQIVVTRDTSGT